ncbi:MAG: hypothetical protein J5771_01820 [Bacteroidales bacterium]|nr:hypothetical protein [Bacteroidales bacterium]
MKKVFLAIAAMLLVASAFSAQAAKKGGFDKKNIYVGGTVGYTSTSVKMTADPDTYQAIDPAQTVEGSSLKLIVDFGYDLDKTNSVGCQLGYFTGLAAMGSLDPVNMNEFLLAYQGIQQDLQKGDSDVTGLRFAPYIRHNFISNKTFDLFVDAVLGIESVKQDVSRDDGTGNIVKQGQKYSLFELVARPGIALKLDKNFRLVTRFGSLGYQSIKSQIYQGNTKFDGAEEYSRFGFSVASSGLAIGFEYHF